MSGMVKLIETVAQLRSEEGCPWDKKQTHESLIPYLLEETWEVIDEIQSNKTAEPLKLELGDLLLQVVLHAQIASEEDRFDLDQVAEAIAEKMIHRHPHVFSQRNSAISEQELHHQWNRLKKEKNNQQSVLEGVPLSQPAMLTSFAYGKRAANLGFDWENTEDVYKKILEELGELREEMDKSDPVKKNLEHEIGDLLCAVTTLARFYKINPEIAMKKCNDRFKNRFSYVEDAIFRESQNNNKLTLDEMEEVWQEAKRKLKKAGIEG